MYCISELTRFYCSATCQILHVKSYSCAEHTKSNLHVVRDSDSSAAKEIQLVCDMQAPTDRLNKIE